MKIGNHQSAIGSVVDSDRTKDSLKGILKVSFALRRHGYHEEQLTVSQLGSDYPDILRPASGFVGIGQRRQ